MRIPVPVAVVVGALLGGVVVPFAVQRDRPAKGAFEYVPPEGFVPATGEAQRKLTQNLGQQPAAGDDSRILPASDPVQHPERKAWVATELDAIAPPRIVQIHADRGGRLDESALTRIAGDMVEHQRGQGFVYSTAQKRIVTRKDGARVGLVLWDVESAPESPQPATLAKRTLQLTFPDNQGLTIITAQFLAADGAKVMPRIEASIETAYGVAWQSAPMAAWLRAALALGLAGLGWLVARFTARSREPSKAQ